MKKLHVLYDPYMTEAGLLPDAQVEPYITHLVNQFAEGDEDMHWGIAQDIVLLALRVMICEGKIKAEEVELTFNGGVVPIDENGRINHWPQGMGNYELDLLTRLI